MWYYTHFIQNILKCSSRIEWIQKCYGHIYKGPSDFCQDDIGVHYMLGKLKDAYNAWGLIINTSKTEYMKIEGQGQDLDLE